LRFRDAAEQAREASVTMGQLQLSRDTQSYELRRHPVLRGIAQRNGPGSAR
jgi:hypothetical protein